MAVNRPLDPAVLADELTAGDSFIRRHVARLPLGFPDRPEQRAEQHRVAVGLPPCAGELELVPVHGTGDAAGGSWSCGDTGEITGAAGAGDIPAEPLLLGHKGRAVDDGLGHRHVLQVRNSSFPLPGGRLRPDDQGMHKVILGYTDNVLRVNRAKEPQAPTRTSIPDVREVKNLLDRSMIRC